MNTRSLFFVILICTGAQLAAAKSLFDTITPFTGTDYVRVVVDKNYRLSASSKFIASIRDSRSGKMLWQGPVSLSQAINQSGNYLSFTIRNLKPVLWTPANPVLYELTLQQSVKGIVKNQVKERMGFRSFERRGGNLYLNGRPVFLRGIAINPPGRGIPDKLERSRAFAQEYVSFMKSIHVNIIRIPDEEAWYDVCDELGMMVFGGNYSGKVAGGEKVTAGAQVGDETDGGFPKDYDRGVSWYQDEKLEAIAHHPSLMIYAMTNETPFAGPRAAEWEKFLDYSYQKLKKWDETRVYIANAGYGYGKTGDVTDIHRYWGWYYSSPFTFLHIRNEAELNPYPSKHQPLTFTECVGNYTGPDGRYNLTPAHKNPSSQLAWTGHAADNVQARLADQHQAFTFRQATETFRQLRTVNPDLSGVFPFTILFYNWDTIQKFADMDPKPVTRQVKLSYQPVLLSWESWTPNIFAGSTITPVIHIVNDSDDFTDLKGAKLLIRLRDEAKQVMFADSMPLPNIPYYGSWQKKLEIPVPSTLASGNYELTGEILLGGKQVSENYSRFYISGKESIHPASQGNALLLYDRSGATKQAFKDLGIAVREISSFKDLPASSTLIIGENGADQDLLASSATLKTFVSSGSRIVCMRQDSVHRVFIQSLLLHPVSNRNIDIDNPVYPVTSVSPRNGYYLNPERPGHPFFSGISRENLRIWSDYTGWDESKAGYPKIQPVTDGFTFVNKEDVSSTAILANYSSGLQGVALAEQFLGKGSILLSGLDLVNRIGIDPIAKRLFFNMISYMSADGHDLYPLVTTTIKWGDYESEQGLVTDLYSGFLVSSTPRLPPGFTKETLVTKEGYQLAGGNRSGFNTRPGIQYVANGRRPFGPYAQSFGGQPVPEKGTTVGTGRFWCRIPAGQNRVSSLVWNPGDEDAAIKIKVNDLGEVSRVLKSGERAWIEAPVDSPNVSCTFTGDRRLVVLETTFFKNN